MRHFLRGQAFSVGLLPSRVVALAITGLLMSASGRADRFAPRRRRAHGRTVPIAAVTEPAKEEDLTAVAAAADDKAKRVHVPGAAHQELDVCQEPCDEDNVEPRPRGTA